MRTLLALLTALLVAAVPVAQAAEKYDPYFIDKRELKKQYKRIALAPVEVAADLEMPESAKQLIEAEITKHLEKGDGVALRGELRQNHKRGYTVIPSSVLAGIRSTMIERVGGLTDAATGDVDMAKARAVSDHSLRELWFKNDFDAVGTIRIEVIQAPVENDRAEWDGVKQKVERKGRSLNYTASVAATSVTFAIQDVTEQPLFVNYGGLEVLMMRVKEEFQPLDKSEYFKDEKRIRKAAQLAVKPI